MNFHVRETQIARNRESRDRWSEYSEHRQRITNLLEQSATPNAQLLLLGAGNCNDIDLPMLLRRFATIHLCDLDSEALDAGVSRQGVKSHSNVVLHGGMDVTGIAELCSSWNCDTPPTANEIQSAINHVLQHTWSNIQCQFDVVASIGLLSQLTEIVLRSLGEKHSRVIEFLAAVRLRHMQLLMESARPGGRVILVTEIVSSSSCAELSQTPESELIDLLRRLISQHNFFTGLNPVVLESLWHQSPVLAPLVHQVELSAPWLWNFGPRVYACCALRGVRRSNETEL